MNWYIKVLKKYADFNGRASRVEFWYFTLINLVVFAFNEIIALTAAQSFFTSIFNVMTMEGNKSLDFSGFGLAVGALVGQAILGIYLLAILIPWLAVTIRRLQDTGRSGLYCLFLMLPIVGILALIVFLCEDGQPMENQYGPNPKDLFVSV